jgi:selenocysteine lyase/cysteine desulfurase
VDSEELKMPLFIETGTQNTVGIAGLGAAARFVGDNFLEIESRAAKLTNIIINGLSAIKDVEVLGPKDESLKLPVVSFIVRRDNFSARAMALALDEGYSIAVRGGEHCAPMVHKGFYETGTLRASPGYFNTPEHAEKFVEAVSELLR